MVSLISPLPEDFISGGRVLRADRGSDKERLDLALAALAAAEARALEREAVAREIRAERDELSRGFAAVVTAARSAESAAAATLAELRAEIAALRNAFAIQERELIRIADERVAEAERIVAERDRALVAARVAQSQLAQALEELQVEAVVHQFARRRAERGTETLRSNRTQSA